MKRNAGWLGVLCLLGAGALVVFVPWLTRLRWILVIAGAVLLLASLLLNAREAQGVLGRRGTRYGAGAAVMILLALGVVVFANALSSRHSVRWDFTENRRNTLSPQTVQVLKTLKTPVEAIAFFRTDTPGKRTAEDLLGQYAAQSGGKFTWRLEDTDKAPGLAREYGVESYGTVVIKGGGPAAPRTEKILDAEEEKLTNALVKVTRSGKRIVYVVKGHGEREVSNTERAGFSQARDQMDKANYEVKELLLAQQAEGARRRRGGDRAGAEDRSRSRRRSPRSTRTSPAAARCSSWPRRFRPRASARTSRSTASCSTTTWSSS